MDERSTTTQRPGRATIIADGVKEVATWCLRLLIIGVACWFLLRILITIHGAVIPGALAVIVCAILHPPYRFLIQHKVPSPLAAALLILITLLLFGGFFLGGVPDIARQSRIMYYQAFEGAQRFQLWLEIGPLHLDSAAVTHWFNRTADWVQSQTGTIAAEVISGLGAASSILFTLSVVLVLTFFFLTDGDRFIPWLSHLTGPRVGTHIDTVATRMWSALQKYLRARTVTALVAAGVTCASLLAVGMPLAVAMSVVMFFALFIPIIGALAATISVTVSAFVFLTTAKASVVLAVMIAIPLVEASLPARWRSDTMVRLHPVIVLVSVVTGAHQAGLMGAFLAIPALTCAAVIFRYVDERIGIAAGEIPAIDRVEDHEFLPASGENSLETDSENHPEGSPSV